jgi:hypothetical protein
MRHTNKRKEDMTLKEKINFLFFEQNYRFNIGYKVIALVNFSLLILTNSDRMIKMFPDFIKGWMNATGYPTLVILGIFVPAGFVFVWFVGYILDKFFNYEDNLLTQRNKRDPQISEILKNTRILLNQKPIDVIEEIEDGVDRE